MQLSFEHVKEALTLNLKLWKKTLPEISKTPGNVVSRPNLSKLRKDHIILNIFSCNLGRNENFPV